MRKLFWIGDAACPSGFAKATHYTLDVLRRYWDVYVLGINYLGDPMAREIYPYPIYPATGNPGMTNIFGLPRLKELMPRIKPDVVVIQNDPWNIPQYMRLIDTPIVAAVAIDGKNCRGRVLNGLTGAIFWTEFGYNEARLGGYNGPGAVIPLGVDHSIYYPINKQVARQKMGIPDSLKEAFIVGNVNRNQPRKRLDLTIQYFAEWIKEHKVHDAYLHLHVAPTGDKGIDCEQLAAYYGIKNRLILVEPPMFIGITEEYLNYTYNSFDVQINTGQGEGWGLTTMEGMACGVPQIVPDWSALGEWCKGAAVLIPCTSIATTFNNINVIGGVPDKDATIKALDGLYADGRHRNILRDRGIALAGQECYNWEQIGETFNQALEEFLEVPVKTKPLEEVHA